MRWDMGHGRVDLGFGKSLVLPKKIARPAPLPAASLALDMRLGLFFLRGWCRRCMLRYSPQGGWLEPTPP
jgi:hypothetical protein